VCVRVRIILDRFQKFMLILSILICCLFIWYLFFLKQGNLLAENQDQEQYH